MDRAFDGARAQLLGDALFAEAENCVWTGRCSRELVDRALAYAECVGGSALGLLRNALASAELSVNGVVWTTGPPWVA